MEQVRIVADIVERLQLFRQPFGRYFAGKLVDDMTALVAIDAGQVFRRQLAGENYFFWDAGVSIIRYRTDIPSKPFAARRSNLSPSARSFLCDGVKFCCREGLIRSANHASAHNSSADFERVSVDIVGEVSGCVISSFDIRIIR